MKISSAYIVFSLVAAAPAFGAGSVDAGRANFLGNAAFASGCLTCHGDPATAQRFTPYRFNASGLTSAFQAISAMNGNLSLGAQTINDIATYLGLPDGNDTDRLLDWGEDTFPQILSPARQPTQQFSGYSFRFYPNTGVYVATKEGSVWYYNSRAPGAAIVNLGTLRSFLEQMPNGR